MSKKISRRSFIKKGTALGAITVGTGLIGGSGLSASTAKKTDISVVQGADPFQATITAVKELGGIGQFVPKGSKVALLPNVQRNNPGTFTNPEVLRAVITLCKEAGAKEINCLSWLDTQNWDNTGLKAVVDKEGVNLVLVDKRDESLFKTIAVPNGRDLKEARVMSKFYDNDVFINMPITKDHMGNKFTGTLKNLMGLNSPKNNRTFHKPGWKTDPGDIAFLDQCIADLNTVVTPDLCIVDATQLITTNGPFGPGELIKPDKVIAGTDRVAIDTYCCSLWGLDPAQIFTIQSAAKHNLGTTDLKKLKIKEVKT